MHPDSPCGCLQHQNQASTSSVTRQPASNSEASGGRWNPYDIRQPIRARTDDIPYLRELFQVLGPDAHWLLTKETFDFNWSTNECTGCIACTTVCCGCSALFSLAMGWVGQYVFSVWGLSSVFTGFPLTICSDCSTKLSPWIASIRFHRKVPKSTKDKTIKRLDTIIERLLEKSRSQLVSLRSIEQECTGMNETSREPERQVELQIEAQLPHWIQSPEAALQYLDLLDETKENVTIKIWGFRRLADEK